MAQKIFILGAVVDFQTNNSDNEALMGIHLVIKNGKELSKEQIELVMKVGFSAMNQVMDDVSQENEGKKTEKGISEEEIIKNINNGNFN